MNWFSHGFMEKGQRKDFGCVKLNSSDVVVLGGKREYEGLQDCDFFNLETKRWSEGPRLPVEMAYCRAVVVDDCVYAIGMYKDFYRMRLDQTHVGWQRLPSLKVDGYGCELVSDKKRYIYLIGDNKTRSCIHMYDTFEDRWRILPVMENGRDLTQAVYVDGEIYVIGGRAGETGETAINDFDIFDTATKTWRMGPEVPKRMYGHSATVVGKFIFVCGGQRYPGSKPSANCFVFDIDCQEWITLETSLPERVTGHSSVSWGMSVFILGGSSGDSHETHHIYMRRINQEILPEAFALGSSSNSGKSTRSRHSERHRRPGTMKSIRRYLTRRFSMV